jgi:hypothetical protein
MSEGVGYIVALLGIVMIVLQVVLLLRAGGSAREILEARFRDLQGVRTRQIERKLKSVEALPVIEAQLRLGDLEDLAAVAGEA